MNVHLNWYLVKFVYQSSAINALHKTEFDEEWRWVRADSATWAQEKATVLGRIYERENPKQKNWEFIGTGDIHKISLIEDGAALLSSAGLPGCA